MGALQGCKAFAELGQATNTSRPLNPAVLRSVCQTSCVQGNLTSFQDMVAKVPREDFDDSCLAVRAITMGFQVSCLKGTDDSMCFPKFSSASKFMEKAFTPNEAQDLCAGECISKTARLYGDMMELADPSQSGSRRAAMRMYQAICAQSDNNYCLPEYFPIRQELGTAGDVMNAATLDKVCSPCARLLFGSMPRNPMAALCAQKDPTTKCGVGLNVTALTQSMASCDGLAQAVVAGTTTDGVCPAFASACGVAVDALVSGNGCCTASLVSASIPDLFPSNTQLAPLMEQEVMKMLKTCASSIPDVCRAGSINSARLRIGNLKFDWVNADATRKERFMVGVQKDLATAAGVPIEAVTIKSISAGSVIVDYTIQSSSQAETDAASAAIAGMVEAGTLDLASVMETVAGDPNALVNTDLGLQISNAPASPTNGGLRASVSVPALVAAVLMALARR